MDLPMALNEMTLLIQAVESHQQYNFCVQMHKSSEETTCSVLSALLCVDPGLKAAQALFICATPERADHIQRQIIRHTERGGTITARIAIPTANRPSKGEKVADQVVVGTSGTVKNWMTVSKVLHPKNIKIVVIDEAHQMFEQVESGILLDTKRILKRIKESGGNCRIILFSATSSAKNLKISAMEKFPKIDNWFPVVLGKPSHDVNCLSQITCPETHSKITAPNDRIVEAGITDTVGPIFPQTQTPDLFGEKLALLINESCCETSKLILSYLRNQYLVDDDECKRLRQIIQAHNLEFIQPRIQDKASERRELEAQVNGITSSSGLILDRTRAPYTLDGQIAASFNEAQRLDPKMCCLHARVVCYRKCTRRSSSPS